MEITDSSRTRSIVTVAFCVLAALAEGIDLQSAGIAARGVAMEFGFDRLQVTNYVSFSILGLLFGALIGGLLADRIGRKWVLIGSVVVFGVFSLGTAQAWDYSSMLAMRFLVGLGLGGAMANLVALSSESAPAGYQGTSVGLVYMGLPLGSIITAAVGASIMPEEWRTVFYVGGVTPLIVVPLLAIGLPESLAFQAKAMDGQKPSTFEAIGTFFQALFGANRAPTTLLLWIGFFFCQFAIYLVLNWMPTLLGDQGFDQTQASTLQGLFSIGSIVATLLFGQLLDRISRRVVVLIAFAGAIAAQFSLATVNGLYPMGVAIFSAGTLLAAAQLTLLSTAPLCYGTSIRGRGVGAAVAAGRLGGYVGPTMAGILMTATGVVGPTILQISLPGLILAGIATLIVLLRPRATD